MMKKKPVNVKYRCKFFSRIFPSVDAEPMIWRADSIASQNHAVRGKANNQS
jgi:hypothetical protein